MTKTTSFIIGLVLIVGIGALVFFQNSKTEVLPSSETTSTNVGSETNPNTDSGTGITLAEIATHKNATSCWSSINGNVYDLTAWIPQHPGGPQAILQLCGTDGSAKFNAQHGGAALQQQILAGFKIGVLAK